RPRGSVGILPAILANAGRISLDVAWIMLRPVERRGEQQCQAVIAADQLALDRRHRPSGALGIRDTRHDGPGLGDRIDPAFVARRGADRRAIVEPSPPIPAAVPGLALERLSERRSLVAPLLRARHFAAGLRRRRKSGQGHVREPGQPDAFALALLPDPVHSVVPVAASNQWKSVSTARETRVQAKRAMLVNAGPSVGDGGGKKAGLLAFLQRRTLEEGRGLVEN